MARFLFIKQFIGNFISRTQSVKVLIFSFVIFHLLFLIHLLFGEWDQIREVIFQQIRRGVIWGESELKIDDCARHFVKVETINLRRRYETLQNSSLWNWSRQYCLWMLSGEAILKISFIQFSQIKKIIIIDITPVVIIIMNFAESCWGHQPPVHEVSMGWGNFC